MSRDTLARIDLAALRHNLARVRELAPGCRVASVVKADAYGHGTRMVLPGLEDSDLLAVATVDEMRDLRDCGWQGRLLLLEGFTGEAELEAVRSARAESVLHHEDQLALLERRGEAPPPLWLKLDTGMHRLGYPSERLPALLERLGALPGAEPAVLMSHFACADLAGDALTETQLSRFAAATDGLDRPVSLANSAALINIPASRRDIVRPGILLYGISPLPDTTGEDHGLKPVMTLSCRLLAINEVAAGEAIGYGARYRCPEAMRIGVAGIGYGDGYPRGVPDGAPVLVNGRRARLAGRVSMDMITVDLRDHDEARVGDEVVLWGQGLPVEEVARAAGMIPYELVCGVTGRVRRIPGPA